MISKPGLSQSHYLKLEEVIKSRKGFLEWIRNQITFEIIINQYIICLFYVTTNLVPVKLCPQESETLKQPEKKV